MEIKKARQCAAIIQPGEYTIPRWDNTRCSEKVPYHLVKCETCGKDYCIMFHWGKHKHENA